MIDHHSLSLRKKTPNNNVRCGSVGDNYQLTCKAVAVPMRKAMPGEVMVVDYIVPMDDLSLDGLLQLKLC